MLACVFLYTLSLHLSFSMMRLTLSLDALNHGAGGTEVGILIGLISLCPMLAALKYGRWVDAVGPRKPVCFGALSAAVGVFSIFASMAALMGCAGLWLSAKKCRTQKPEKQA